MCYGVLHDVSIDYPPVPGMLLTRYSPFRRSPSEYCYSTLPLDLHVLSLPLAFILSQDQTLHCIFFIMLSLFLTLLVSLKKLTLVCTCFLVLSFSLFNELFNDPLGRIKSRSFQKRDCKGTHIF